MKCVGSAKERFELAQVHTFGFLCCKKYNCSTCDLLWNESLLITILAADALEIYRLNLSLKHDVALQSTHLETLDP